jgi:hypothetical protein
MMDKKASGNPRKATPRQIRADFALPSSPPAHFQLQIKAKSLCTHRTRSLRRARSVKMGSRGLGVSGAPPEPPRRRRARTPEWPGRPWPRPRSASLYVDSHKFRCNRAPCKRRQTACLSGEFRHDMSHFGSSGQYACTLE